MAVTEVTEEAARSWQMLVDRIGAEADDRVRSNLEIVAHHVVAEVAGDLDELMTTLVEDPHYVFVGALDTMKLDGRDAVRGMYEQATEQGWNRLEFHLSRVVADHGSVVTEGTFRQAYTGELLSQIGSPNEAEPLVAEQWYLSEQVSLIVWPISADGLIEGERVYWSEKPRVIRPLRAGEHPHLGPVTRA
jgi:limonene-1,2-epoxide hydrolase